MKRNKRRMALKQREADLVREAEALHQAAATGGEDGEGRALTAEEREQDERIEKDLQAIDQELADIERQERRANRVTGGRTGLGGQTPGEGGAAARGEAEPVFGSFGEMLQEVRQASLSGRPTERLMQHQEMQAAATGLNETVPQDGAFLVGTDVSTELLRRSYEVGQIAQRVRRIPISANSNGLKVNAIDETSRADGSRWGGVQVLWTEEAGALAGTRPKFRQMELGLKKLGALVYVTDELMADSVALEAIVREALPEEINFRVEDAILNGSGAGQPQGYLNSGAVVTVAKETGQAAATVVYQNIVNMWSRMYSRSRQNAVWLINQDVEPQLYTMSLAVGTGGAPVFLPPGGASGSPFSTLFGRPVIPVEYCSTLGTVGDIQLVDPSQYLMIDKGAIRSASSMHVRFEWEEMVLRFTYRVDGQSIWRSALTPKNGSNTQSPFVVLATRS